MSEDGSFFDRMAGIAFAPAVVATNVTSGLFNLGVETTARSLQVGARLMEPFVPGARGVQVLNREVGTRAATMRRKAFGFAFKGLKMTLGRLRDEDFDHLPEGTPVGFNQLIADTAAGPAMSVLLWPLSSVFDLLKGATELGPIKDNLDLGKRGLNAMLDTFSVSGENTRMDTVQLRDHFLSMTIGPGGSVMKDVVALLEGSLRASMGNTRRLGKAIKAGVDAMRYPVEYKEVEGLVYPEIPISQGLYEAAKIIVDNEPRLLIEALEAEDPVEISRALTEEPGKVLTFFFYYQWALLLVIESVAKFLQTGLRDVNDVERYVLDEDDLFQALDREKRFEGKTDHERQEILYEELELRGKERPFTVTEFEFYVGNAKSKTHGDLVAHLHPHLPPGPFAQATINYAQETAFSYSSLLLGERDEPGSRERALDRVQRLYGEDVRRRIERDPSLAVIQFRKGLGEFVDTDVEEFIEGELEGRWGGDWEEYYAERIDFLERYRDDPNTILLGSITDRIDHRIAILEEVRRQLRLEGRARASAEKRTVHKH